MVLWELIFEYWGFEFVVFEFGVIGFEMVIMVGRSEGNWCMGLGVGRGIYF